MKRVTYGVKGSPYVRKVRIALNEKKLEYEFQFMSPFEKTEAFLKISPLGKIPVLREDDLTLPDSSVICAYLEKQYPESSLYPADPVDYARALWFEEYGDDGLFKVITGEIFFPSVVVPFINKVSGTEVYKVNDKAEIDKVFQEKLPPLCDYLEQELGNKQYLVADRFTIADIGIISQFINLYYSGYEVDKQRWPSLAGYIDFIRQRDSIESMRVDERASLNLTD